MNHVSVDITLIYHPVNTALSSYFDTSSISPTIELFFKCTKYFSKFRYAEIPDRPQYDLGWGADRTELSYCSQLTSWMAGLGSYQSAGEVVCIFMSIPAHEATIHNCIVFMCQAVIFIICCIRRLRGCEHRNWQGIN